MKGQHQVPDFKALDGMNAFLTKAGAGFVIDRTEDNLGVTIGIWQGRDDDGAENFIDFLGFMSPDIDDLNNEYDNLAAYCFVAKVGQGHFEDDAFRYFFSLEKRSLFVIDKNVLLTNTGPIYFKSRELVTKTIDKSIIQLPEA